MSLIWTPNIGVDIYKNHDIFTDLSFEIAFLALNEW